MSRSQYWCFTLNNYTENDILYYRSLVGRQLATYCVFGYEVGASGTRHLQGYVELPRRLRLAGARDILPNAHLENRRGNAQQARDYCCKDGNFEEEGTISITRQGSRTDLEELKESLNNKRSLTEISEDHFSSFLRYERSIKSYKFLHSKPRDPNIPPEVYCFWGKTGTGKTRLVWQLAQTPEIVWVYPGKGWFDGFDDHEIALFDDFRGSSMELHLLLQVLDRYPLKVRIKGSHVNWNPKKIYLTSNVHPSDWYPNVDQESRNALMRRFNEVREFE